MILESGFKLIFAVSLVIFGFYLFGAIVGVVAGVFTGLIFALYFNKEILDEKSETTSFNGIYAKSAKYFIVMFVILLVFSLDIILAKRFFSPELAGKYAVLSMLGKMIFLGTMAVGNAMFPLTSEKSHNKKDSTKLFRKSLIAVGLLCLIAVILFSLIPKLIVGILYGPQYVDMAQYLVYSGLALSFLSMSKLVLIYGLSVDRIKNSAYLFVFLILEIVLLSLFHDNLLEYILAFMVSNIIMFIGSFFFLIRD